MNYLNDATENLRSVGFGIKNSGFTRLLAFEYYDGPEFGVALYASGSGVRFKVLSESPKRLFRAFEVVPLSLSCEIIIDEALRECEIYNRERIIFPKSRSIALDRIEQRILNEKQEISFFAVGDPLLEKWAVRERNGSFWPDSGNFKEAFNRIHRYIKSGEA